ncbi:hypothetical protein BG011_007810 [Mortierella polycephala]|uniref:LsmAD domain-containing protein n=1 Tax=Mortierella polycephala TaxID=41804 RepID=A0A9P6TXU4_9FUNG|nr:hypothetical protein BG011_007810 [Mortierella polycephala]
MTTYSGRSANKGGKAVFVQRGGKGKWGAQSPSTANQPGFTSSGSPVPPSTSPGPASQANKETVVNEANTKHMHDRMLFLLSNMIGMTVELTVKNGSKYEGLFHTAFTEGDLGIVLRLAKAVSGKDKKENAPMISQMIVLAKDCMAISVVGVDFVPHERSGAERGEREGFKTDTDISRSGDIRERDLKKWAPEEHSTFGGIEDDMADSHRNNNTTWDQFAVNEKLFGVKTDFDEELYTTKLDRTGADFKAREQHAIQIANEIQQSTSTNVHMREERGLAVDDSGLDEEDLYGAVVRDPLPASNKYTPPAKRRQQELSQQRRPSTPSQQQQQQQQQPSRAPPAPATPVQSVSTAQTTKAQAPTATATPATQPQKPATVEIPARVTDTATTAPASAKPAEPATVSRSNSTKGANGQFNLNDLRKHNPVSTLLNAATIQGSKNQQIPEHAVDSKQIEDNLAKFAMTARSFATHDKALINQTKMGLTQRKTELFQKEKDGLAAELKQFGKELTKKLNTPVPDDVKEIFGKRDADKSKDAKQDTATKSTTSTTTTTTTTTTAVTTATLTATDKAKTEKPSAGKSFSLNPKASSFKPNPNAVPFTPSFAGGGDKKNTAASAAQKDLFFGKSIKKGPRALKESMSSPFKKGQTTPNPASITPTWPYGSHHFLHMFQVTNRYDEDMMYSQAMGGQHAGNGAGGYYAMAPYNYGPTGQFGVPPPMTMAGPNHMVPFMGSGGPVPFSQPPPPPPPGMPHTGAAHGFPQMAPTSAAHYAPQGFPPGRSGMIAPTGMHFPIYPYPPTPHGAPVMMRYTPPEMMPPMGPNGMMMHQRPMGMDPQMMHYPAAGTPGRDNAPNEEAAPETTGAGN